MNILVSPASPEKAIRVCLLRCRVLSSEAFKTVTPRIAALEAATNVKSLPVMPSSTSLALSVHSATVDWDWDRVQKSLHLARPDLQFVKSGSEKVKPRRLGGVFWW